MHKTISIFYHALIQMGLVQSSNSYQIVTPSGVSYELTIKPRDVVPSKDPFVEVPHTPKELPTIYDQ